MLDFISNIFKPAADLVDELHVSDEERLKLRNELARIQADMQAKSVELMTAEAKSDHFIVAAWRPLIALLLFSLILADGYGLANAPDQVYNLAEIFLSVYGGSRGLEKVARIMKK
jgi:hypothetical protein